MADLRQASLESETVVGRRKLWAMIAIVLALVGAGISLYSIKHHNDLRRSGQTDAFCNINQTFSCDDVAGSVYSEVGGIPLGAFGLAYFLACVVLLGIGLKGGKDGNRQSADGHLQAYALMVLAGVLVSLGLGGLSIIKIGAVCLTCIGVYVVTLLQALALWWFRAAVPSRSNVSLGSLGNGLISAVMLVVAVVVAYRALVSPPPKGPSPDDLAKLTEESKSGAPGANLDALRYAPKTYEIPVARSAYVDAGEDFRKGSEDARLVLVEFADFQCPACARFAEVLGTLAKEFPNETQVVYKNFPLDNSCNSGLSNQVHEHACAMALAGRCAGQFGKFWEYHDLAFQNQKDASAENIKKWLIASGVNAADIETCMAAPGNLQKLKADIELGTKVEVDGTPSLYINGRKYIGDKDLNTLRSEVQRLLAQ